MLEQLVEGHLMKVSLTCWRVLAQGSRLAQGPASGSAVSKSNTMIYLQQVCTRPSQRQRCIEIKYDWPAAVAGIGFCIERVIRKPVFPPSIDGTRL
jgi:hypothetical protein